MRFKFTLSKFFLAFFIGITSLAFGEENIYSSSDSLSKMDIEDLIAEVEGKMISLEAKKNSTHIDSLFDLLKYEPYLKNHPEIKYQIFRHFSGTLNNKGAYLLSAEYTKLSIKYGKMAYPNRHFAALYGQIGWAYYQIGVIDSAVFYVKKSILDKDEVLDSPSRFSPLNNLGMLYHEIKNDSAWYYYDLALSIIEDEKIIFSTNIRDNMAEYKYDLGFYQEAISINLENEAFLKSSFKGKNEDSDIFKYRSFKVQIGIAKSLLKLKKYKEAKNRLEKAAAIIQTYKNAQNFTKKSTPELHSLCQNYYHSKGDYKNEAIYQDLIIQRQKTDATDKNLTNKFAMNTLFDLKISRFKKELELQASLAHEREQKLQNQKLKWYFSLLSFLAIISFGFLFYKRKLAFKKQELKIHKIESKLAKAEAEKQALEKQQIEKDLMNVSNYLSDNRAWTEEVVEQLETISNNASKQEINTLVKDIKSRQQVNERVKLLYDNIDKVNHAFNSNLISHYPNLTEVEKEICGLLRLNLSNKDIAAYRNVTPQAVKMSRYRLRKKLNITADINIYTFLQTIDN